MPPQLKGELGANAITVLMRCSQKGRMNLRYLPFSIAVSTSLLLACVLAIQSANSSNEYDGARNIVHPLPISAEWASGGITTLLTYTMYLPFVSANGNLLKNGDFESPPPWPMQNELGEIRVAPDWRAWYLDQPPSYVTRPYNCDGRDSGCYWTVPEFGDVQKAAYAYRVHSGDQAQKYFTYGRMHEAGLYQQVSGIQSGAHLRFSIYMQAWMCFEWLDCNYGRVSDKPSDMHLKVGIDPTGGDNPFSPNIIWSLEQPAWDAWALFQVEAIAKNSSVTVYTHSRPDWDWARKNNDVYIDDARLVVVP